MYIVKINNNIIKYNNYLYIDQLKIYTCYRYESNKDTINNRYIPNNKQLSKRLINKYKLNINNNNELKQFSIHIICKSETSLIECYLYLLFDKLYIKICYK